MTMPWEQPWNLPQLRHENVMGDGLDIPPMLKRGAVHASS